MTVSAKKSTSSRSTSVKAPKKKSNAKKKVAKKSTAKRGATMAAKKAKGQKKKESLIGIDPLAWLNDEPEAADETNVVEKDAEVVVDACEEQVMNDEEVTMESKSVEPGEAPEKNDKCDGNVIALGETLTIREINDVYAQISASLPEDVPLKLDCSQLEKIDTSGLQMLTVLSRYRSVSGQGVELLNPTESLKKSSILLGLDAELALAS